MVSKKQQYFRWTGKEQVHPLHCRGASRSQGSIERQVVRAPVMLPVTLSTIKVWLQGWQREDCRAGRGRSGSLGPGLRGNSHSWAPSAASTESMLTRTNRDDPGSPFPLHTACQSLRTDTHTVSPTTSFPAVEKHLEQRTATVTLGSSLDLLFG